MDVRTGIPKQVDEAFRLTGTSHVIAISGQIARILWFVLSSGRVEIDLVPGSR